MAPVMRALILVLLCVTVLLTAFLLGQLSVECAPVDTAGPSNHVIWLTETGHLGPIIRSPEREDELMSAAEARAEQYAGFAMPVHYIEWRGWVFVIVHIKPMPAAPISEYRILAYREVGGKWFLLDEWRWFVDVAY